MHPPMCGYKLYTKIAASLPVKRSLYDAHPA